MDDEDGPSRYTWKTLLRNFLLASLLDDGVRGIDYGNYLISAGHGSSSNIVGHSAHVLPELVDNSRNRQKTATATTR